MLNESFRFKYEHNGKCRLLISLKHNVCILYESIAYHFYERKGLVSTKYIQLVREL